MVDPMIRDILFALAALAGFAIFIALLGSMFEMGLANLIRELRAARDEWAGLMDDIRMDRERRKRRLKG